MRRDLPALATLALALTLLIAGCSSQPSEPTPPPIDYGQAMCAACGMLISEPRFAAALILETGDPVLFDDAGEMFAYPRRQPEAAVRAWFVHDYHSEAWVNARQAVYVVHPSIETPMATGLAAFESRANAEALGQSLGVPTLTFDELIANPPGMGMH